MALVQCGRPVGFCLAVLSFKPTAGLGGFWPGLSPARAMAFLCASSVLNALQLVAGSEEMAFAIARISAVVLCPNVASNLSGR